MRSAVFTGELKTPIVIFGCHRELCGWSGAEFVRQSTPTGGVATFVDLAFFMWYLSSSAFVVKSWSHRIEKHGVFASSLLARRFSCLPATQFR